MKPIQFNFIYIESVTLKTSSSGRRTSLQTRRNLEQDQAHMEGGSLLLIAGNGETEGERDLSPDHDSEAGQN